MKIEPEKTSLWRFAKLHLHEEKIITDQYTADIKDGTYNIQWLAELERNNYAGEVKITRKSAGEHSRK